MYLNGSTLTYHMQGPEFYISHCKETKQKPLDNYWSTPKSQSSFNKTPYQTIPSANLSKDVLCLIPQISRADTFRTRILTKLLRCSCIHRSCGYLCEVQLLINWVSNGTSYVANLLVSLCIAKSEAFGHV